MNLSRRGLFVGVGAVALASSAPKALLANPDTLLANDVIADLICARLDAIPDREWRWSEEERYAYKCKGGWPGYGGH